MASLNKVFLIGNLVADVDLRYTQSGSPVANFRMATNESYNDQSGQRVDKAEFHRIVVWGRQAETVSNYLHKGSQVYVEGSIQTKKWQAQDGSDRYSTEIKALRVQFLDPKGDGQGQQSGQRRQAPQRQQQDDDLGPAFPSEASGMDDVPF